MGHLTRRRLRRVPLDRPTEGDTIRRLLDPPRPLASLRLRSATLDPTHKRRHLPTPTGPAREMGRLESRRLRGRDSGSTRKGWDVYRHLLGPSAGMGRLTDHDDFGRDSRWTHCDGTPTDASWTTRRNDTPDAVPTLTHTTTRRNRKSAAVKTSTSNSCTRP